MADQTADQDEDHQVAYIFNPLLNGGDDDGDGDHDGDGRAAAASAPRPLKRRKVSKAGRGSKKPPPAAADMDVHGDAADEEDRPPSYAPFVPLLDGAERPAAVRRRRALFEASWARADARIQSVLRRANETTLDEVGAFVRDAPSATTKIPAAFIITGPSVTPRDLLLFEQLAEALRETCGGRFVRVRAAEAPNLKATLKKIIRDVVAGAAEGAISSTNEGEGEGEGEGEADVAVGGDGRKYLDYDLEAMYSFLKHRPSRRVVIAFEDSEAFDSGLLCDLIELLNSWHNRIHFTLLFGVATSVDLFQARLLRSTTRHLYGAQFDVVQMASVLDSLVRCAVAGAAGNDLRVGPSLLRSLVDRQTQQVAGVHVFISSLKYAHMCHFYANPLSVFTSATADLDGDFVQPEHLECVRSLPSFRRHVEDAVEAGRLRHAERLLEDDGYLKEQITEQRLATHRWADQLLRSLCITMAVGTAGESFTELYMTALAEGVDSSPEDSILADRIRRMGTDDIISLCGRLMATIKDGDADMGLEPWDKEASAFVKILADAEQAVKALKSQAERNGSSTLRSKYTAESRILRTTVVAQKVQLSQDSATLTAEDKAFTAVVDQLVEQVCLAVACDGAESCLLHEAWLFDSRTPWRDVFVPKPGLVLERALARPHDYLACSCCGEAAGGVAPTLPATSILYHLYLEAGPLVNVADLWSAFLALVSGKDRGGEEEGEEEEEKAEEDNEEEEEEARERMALALFYRSLAELKVMGFVKSSRKKADHIAKVKWL